MGHAVVGEVEGGWMVISDSYLAWLYGNMRLRRSKKVTSPRKLYIRPHLLADWPYVKGKLTSGAELARPLPGVPRN